MTTLAYDILRWTRANKKKLQELVAGVEQENARSITLLEQEQCSHDAAQMLGALLSYERRYRGAAHLLRNPQHPDCTPQFHSGVRSSVEWIIELLLKTRKRLGVFDSLLDLQGLEHYEFRNFYKKHLAAKLRDLSREQPNIAFFHASSEAWRTNGRGASLKGWVIELSNGMAKKTHEDFISLDLPDGIGEGTLRTQLEHLAQGWITARDTFKAFIGNKANWPTEGMRIEDEKAAIRKLADNFFKSLTGKDAELLRKHPDAFREQFNARFWK